ncbi:nodulation protein S (NodS) [Pseudoduganella lurida]|uniref:Nodulation protein S (NodS) n=1 Tax=Pseudoduganella lurida TaxID=1036180 RepID=A0A562RMC2_9BURK|nr:methyltransferase domain-containing protein [Pseudoduganella lurida]TWI69764.1 nodulation protein S (NodS) [Pseudoduganella lurida]
MGTLDHFESLYAASDDPWNVRGAWYEQRKRAVLLASLRKPRYRSAFEPGCGNGEMTAALAQRCDRVMACDGSASAIAAAAQRLRDAAIGNVDLRRCDLPEGWPAGGTHDLVVISELGYYFDAAALGSLLALARAHLAEDGELMMCHYLHDFDDRMLSTAAVHALADGLPGMVRTVQHRDADFLLEAWSPATLTGGAA